MHTALKHGHSHETAAPAHDHSAVMDRSVTSTQAPELGGVASSLAMAAQVGSMRAAVPPAPTARGTPETLSLLCVLLL